MYLHSNLTTADEIKRQAVHIINDFIKCAGHLNCPPVEWSFLRRRDVENNQAIRIIKRNDTLSLAICSDNILGIPAGALQGWLELDITYAILEADSDLCRFSFQDQIMPLMPVAGGSLYFIRELVEHLSRALKKLEATKIILKMDRGLPQAYYYFYRINPTAEDRKLYKQLLPHNWSRASHLCRKLGDYMALSCLTSRNVGFSRTLLTDWQKQQRYAEKDQVFMEDMVLVADLYKDSEFSFRLVEMFKLLKESLLIAGRDDTGSDGHDRVA